jgi:L-threonate 2-dehydrogenase
MKFIANHLVAIHNAAAAEAMVLAMKAGLDADRVVEVIGSGAGTSRMFELRAPMMAANTYLPATARLAIFKKDLTVIGDFASGLTCPTPLWRGRSSTMSFPWSEIAEFKAASSPSGSVAAGGSG